MQSRLAGLCTLAAVASASLTASATNTAQPTRISLPSGPGSIEGLGRSFAPSLASGTASYGVDVAVPPAAGGFGPHLSLDYDGGAGVSELGMGWHLSGVPRIRRRTENGLPRFDATDAFEVTGLGVPCDLLEVSPGFYRPEYESGAFVRVQRAGDAWEARTKAGIVYRFGGGAGYVEAEGEHVATWLLRESFDLHGHRVAYTWDASGGYARLTKVTWNDFGDAARNEVTLAYEARPDVHVLFNDGIKKTLDARVTAIEVKHGGALVRRYDVHYGAGLHSRIASVDMLGRDGVSKLPTLSFAYTEPSFAANGQVVAMATAPGRSPSDPDIDIADLDGDGLPDLLVGKPGAFRSYVNHDGKSWRSGEDWPASSSPSVALSTTGVQLADADGDGAVDLMIKSGVGDFRYLPGRNATSFAPSVAIPTALNVSFEDPDVKLADMDGDRRVDVVMTSASGLYIGYNQNGTDWSAPTLVGTVDPRQALRFSDGGHTQLCDVNGDRVQDFCYLRSQSLVYWLGRGRGVFEAAQTATGVPTWDPSSPWELRDLDGDGWVDLVHVGVDQVDVALAIGAGRFDAPKSITGTPYRGPNTTVRFADMNGSGTTDIVWIDVSGSPDHAWQYLELFPGGRAGLLTKIDNGLGKIETIDYSPSGLEAAAARAAGAPWTTRMNVPMPIVKRTYVDASLGDPVLTAEYDYRDGTWSGVERTFAGFGGGTQRSIGDEYTPTLLEQFTYDTGVADRTQRGLVLSHALLDAQGRIFSRTTQAYASTTLETAPNGRAVRYTYLASRKVEAIELGDESKARTTLTEYEQDAHGNATREAHWGEVVGADRLAGHDERIVLRTYADNDADWILGRLSTEETQDATGARVRMHRVYYDGAPFVGLPLGQVARGDVARTEEWIAGDAFELATASAYDADGNPLETKDARGGGRIFQWDPADHASLLAESVKTEQGLLTERASYDGAFGTLLSATGYGGDVTRMEYDAFGRIVAVIKPGDSSARPTLRYAYEQTAPLSRIRTERRVWSGRDDAERTEDWIDGLGRHRASVEPYGSKFVLANVVLLDAQGGTRRNVRARFVDSGTPDPKALFADAPGVDAWHDATGRTVRTRTQLGIETRTAFEPFVSKSWDGAQTDASSTYEHTPLVSERDGLGRIVAKTSVLGGVALRATFAYGAADGLLAKTDPEGNVSRYSYDGRGRRVAVDDPDTGKHGFVYDATGNLVEHHKPDGSIRRYGYDLAGRSLVDDLDGDGKPEVTHAWDARGLLTRTTEPSGFTEYEYDERRRTTRTRYGIGDGVYDVKSAYDAQDREYWHAFPDGSSIRVHRDERGLVVGYGSAVTLAYDADGALMQTAFATGVQRVRGYDDDRRPTAERVKDAGGAILQELRWAYDGAGNVLSVADARPAVAADRDRSEQYGYDNLYRLTSAKGAWGQASWIYSASGNMTARASAVAALAAPALGYGGGAGPHALTTFGDRAIRYDALGRMTDDGARTYAWNGADELVRVAARSGATVDSVFDAAGARRIRIERAADGRVSETRFIDATSEVRDGKLARFIVHGGERLARLADGNGVEPPPGQGKGGCHTASHAPGELMIVLVAAIGLMVAARRRVVAALLACAALALAACSSDGGSPPILEGSIQGLSDADELLLSDGLGSLTEEISGMGAPKGSFGTYPYGLARFDTSPETRKYAGTPRDVAIGVDLMGVRAYVPELGVWTSPDPLRVSEPERGLRTTFARDHAYAYAGLAPTSAVDRDGRDPAPWWASSSIVQGVAGFALGFMQGITPGGMLTSVIPTGEGTKTATFQYWQGAGQTVGGAGGMISGIPKAEAGVAMCATGVGCAAGAPVTALGAASVANGVVAIGAGRQNMQQALMAKAHEATGTQPDTSQAGTASTGRVIPRGFTGPEQFDAATSELRAALAKHGITDAKVGVRGSAVTGVGFKSGEPFGPHSDIDFFVESNQLTSGLPKSTKIPNMVKPEVLLENYPGLSAWSERWSGILGREVTPAGFATGAVPPGPQIMGQ